ncbi:hypothetical protein KNV79_gp61 [Salmonella phage vB_SalP_TR2]|uniref:Uncharacterized protein n=1 Tax=Salmonella phage vB_SalP_TR2 TaxID=2812854 RepID=A0A898KA52_9CAUD|nr:hypothetical protein KNV79_gp61 [Salmonella phage vB_SalP_TR2]QSJ04037.1 hypothetical protein [Salmonella phage vB_SalP_TR2]
MSEVKKVITVADRSTKALVVAIAGLGKITSDLSALGDITVKLADEIEFKQSQLDNLDIEFDNKFREASAELRLRIKEDENGVLKQLLSQFGLAYITNDALQTLQNDLAQANEDYSGMIADAESAGFRKGAAEFQAKLKEAESAHRINVAELTAKSNAKDDKIKMLEAQVAQLQSDIKSERETRLAIAQAEAGRQGVVVNTSK